jgi:Tfp pilus assembly protein PilV
MKKIHQKTKKNYQCGFTLVESMIAVGLIVTGVMGVLTLVSRSLGFSGLAFNRLVAANLAQEGVEVVRNIRDTNWLNKQGWDNGLADGTYQLSYASQALEIDTDQSLLLDETTGLFNYEAGKQTPYKRKVELTHTSSNELKVAVTISWIGRGGGKFDTIIEDHLFNWF